MARLALVLGAATIITSACGAGAKSPPYDPGAGERIAEAAVADGPVLQADYVVWGEGGLSPEQDDILMDEKLQPLRVLVAAPGKSPRVAYEQATSPARPEWWLTDLAGSAAGFGFVRAWSPCRPPDYGSCGLATDAGTGAHDRRITFSPLKTEGCESGGPVHVDVEGTRVLFSACGRIALDDVADPQPPRTLIRIRDTLDQIRLAGRFVAARPTNGGLFVYDLERDRISYRPRLPASSEETAQIELQPDGKLVVAWGGFREPASVAWFSPLEPAAHVISVHPRRDSALRPFFRLANDHVAFERNVAVGKSELVVADLGGSAQHVATFDSKHRRVGGFDFDGTRVTWATQEVHDVTKECWRISEAGHMACQEYYSGPTTIYLARLR